MIERFALLWSVVSQEVRKCWIDRRERSSGTMCSKGNPREDRNRWLFQIQSNLVDYPEIVWKQYSRTKLTNYPYSGNTFHICCHHRSTRPNRCRIANGLGLETKLLEDHLKYFPTNFYIWILENRGWGRGVITLPYSVLNLIPPEAKRIPRIVKDKTLSVSIHPEFRLLPCSHIWHLKKDSISKI